MTFLRYTLHPHSCWQTPWQADTLWGRLACEHARQYGHQRMRRDLQDPAREGNPPWVLSDAFPGDLLPLPAFARGMEVAPVQRKRLKALRWLPRDLFAMLLRQPNELPHGLLEHSGLEGFTAANRWQNSIRRDTGTTGSGDDDGGGLFARTDYWPAPESGGFLTLYARVKRECADLLTDLLRQLGESGYGADAGTGRGTFQLDDPVEETELDAVVGDKGGCVVLSSFQPAPEDPVDGSWELFVKHGKVAADVLPGASGFKHPMTLLRPGASFSAAAPAGWLGRALPMDAWLSEEQASTVRESGRELCHFLFGLAVATCSPAASASASTASS